MQDDFFLVSLTHFIIDICETCEAFFLLSLTHFIIDIFETCDTVFCYKCSLYKEINVSQTTNFKLSVWMTPNIIISSSLLK